MKIRLHSMMTMMLLLLTLAVPGAMAADEAETLLFHNPATPRLGASDAALTVVVFTDYNCPYCKRLDPLLEQLVERNPQVAVAFKLLPFKGESSHQAAQLALTLWRQQPERFLALHRALMAKRGYHSTRSIQAALQRSGNADLQADSQGTIQELRDSLLLAQVLGVQGTPTLVIGNQLIPGAIDYDQLTQAVETALAQRP